jgi:hypothetical protein
MPVRALVAATAVGFGLGLLVALLFIGGHGGRANIPRSPGGGRAAPSAQVSEEEATVPREKLNESEARVASLQAEVEVLTRRLESREEAARRRPPHGEGRGPRFVYSETERGLRAADWKEAGEALNRLMPLLSEVVEVTHGRKELRAELWGDIWRWLGPVITQAVKLEREGVPWSHPSVLVNLIHATLRQAGRPLTEAQEEELYRIGLRFVEEDGRRRAGYGEETLRLRQMVEEVRIQDRLYAAAAAILNEEQRAVLYPPGVRGVVGLDIFSGGTVWDEQFERLPHGEDRAGLREQAVAKHRRQLGLRAELEPVLRVVVGEWEAALPEDWVLDEPDPFRRADPDLERSDRILFAATRQLKLYEALLSQAPLNEEERRRVLEHDRVYVPFLQR